MRHLQKQKAEKDFNILNMRPVRGVSGLTIEGKRGDERTLSLYWFVMFVIITIAVVSGVVLFYGRPFDVRAAESQILSDKLLLCVVHDGVLDARVFASEGFSLERDCSLTFTDTSIAAYTGKQQFYVSVRSGGNEKTGGNIEAQYQAFCKHEGSFKNIPVCVQRRVMVLDKRGEGEKGSLVPLDITAVVAKREQNAHS